MCALQCQYIPSASAGPIVASVEFTISVEYFEVKPPVIHNYLGENKCIFMGLGNLMHM